MRGADGAGVRAARRGVCEAETVIVPGVPQQNLAEDLARLAALHRTGELTDTQYADAKARVLHPSVCSY